jgi:glyoxylase-like metal-dependent hydrolase (beta-lactamase superfamily II)
LTKRVATAQASSAAPNLQQVSNPFFAVLNEKNRVRDANSGLINLGGGVVIDTQSDLPHGRRMIELFGKVWPGMPKRVINTHEDGDPMWGNAMPFRVAWNGWYSLRSDTRPALWESFLAEFR